VRLEGEAGRGEPLLQPAMRSGRRLAASPALDSLRADHASAMRALPPQLRGLAPARAAVRISPAIVDLARRLDLTTP